MVPARVLLEEQFNFSFCIIVNVWYVTFVCVYFYIISHYDRYEDFNYKIDYYSKSQNCCWGKSNVHNRLPQKEKGIFFSFRK